jgi:transcriptional regulator with XRE-family HTH domain
MAQVGTRVMRQRRLRAELRRIRERAGRTQKDAAGSLGWSTSKIIRIETGVVAVSPADVMALLHVYELDDRALADELIGITRSKDAMWWDEYRNVLEPQFLDFLDYENSAVRIRQHIGFVVPGLLQTKEYTAAVLDSYSLDADAVRHRTDIRMRRQQRLSEKDGPRASFVLDEAVLHRTIGGPAVMRDQLARIKEAAREPNITIQVVPFEQGTHRAMIGNFMVLEFAPGDGDPVVNIEDPHREVMVRDDPEMATRYLETFRDLEDFAADADQVDAIVDRVLETMPRER